MFSIICRTCAARLKVKNEAAIGQRLACPKCGEMVQVTPPPGWKPSHPAAAASSSDIAGNASVPSSDFDDIDQIIGGTAAPPQTVAPRSPAAKTARTEGTSPASSRPGSASPRRASPQTVPGRENSPERAPSQGSNRPSGGTEQQSPPSSQKSAKSPQGDRGAPAKPEFGERHRAPSAASPAPPHGLPPIDPIVEAATAKPPLAPRDDLFELTQPREYLPDANLPPPDWTAKKSARGQAFLVGSLLFVGLIGVIAAIIALLNQSQDSTAEKTLAQAEPAPVPAADQNSSASAKAPEAELPPAEDREPPVQPAQGQPPEDETAETKESPSVSEPAEPKDDGESESTDNALPGSTERPVSPPVAEANPLAPSSDSPSESPVAGNSAAGSEPPTAVDVAPSATSLTDRLGKLSQLLSGPGTSLTELGDLAQSERTDRLVGLPRYLISQPEPFSPPSDPGSLPIAEIEYRDTPLHLFLSELSALSGVTFCLDGLALSRAGIAVDTPVSIQLTDTTFGEVISQVLTQLKLEQSTLEGVQWIQPAGAQTTQTYRFPLPKVSEPSQEKYERLAANLPKLIDQVSWTLDTANRKSTIEGQELVISNSSTAAGEVQEFLSKLNAAQELKTNRDNAAAAERLKTRSARSAQGLDQKLILEPTLDLPLESFLQRVHQETGVAIIVDWGSLAGAGWSNRSVVPGDFRADTVELLLQELARSLSCTWLAIDEHTFQLTSFNEASRRQLVEVHSLEGLAIEAQPLMEILTQTLGGELRANPLVQFLYEPEANALIVVGPQPLQRQFEAIVNRLKQPANR